MNKTSKSWDFNLLITFFISYSHFLFNKFPLATIGEKRPAVTALSLLPRQIIGWVRSLVPQALTLTYLTQHHDHRSCHFSSFPFDMEKVICRQLFLQKCYIVE